MLSDYYQIILDFIGRGPTNRCMAKPEDVRLGQLLIRKRWCALRQINRCLELQSTWKSQGKKRPFGWILVREEGLDIEKLKMALSELGVLRLSCPSCNRETPISNYVPKNSYRCPKCSVDLTLDENVTTSSGSSPSIIHEYSGDVNNREGDSSSLTTSSNKSVEEDTILGKIVGGCQVLSQIARGGMGVVYS